MPLVAVKVKSGRAFSIYVLTQDGKSDIADFIEELQASEPGEWSKIQRYLDYTKDHGLLKNREQFKSIGNGFWEFRTWNGVRIFCFLDAGQMMLCTSGYIKKKNKIDASELERMSRWKARYESAKKSKSLSFEEEII